MPTALEWIAFVFAIITVPFYCFLITILHKEMRHETKRSNSFYLVCCIVGYIDIICLLNNYLIFMPPRWGWFTSFYLKLDAPLLHICFFISWGCNTGQLHGTMLMALNRFTALVYAQRHDTLWKDKTLLITAIILVPALLMGGATLISPVEYQIENEELTQKLTNRQLTHLYYGIVGVLLILYSIVIFGIYGIIFYTLKMHQQSKIGQTAPVSTITPAFSNRALIHKRRETKLLLMSISVCIVQLVITFYITFKFVFGAKFDTNLDIYNFLVVFYCGINPYLLFGLSDAIRQRSFRCFSKYVRFIRRPATPTKTNQLVMTYPKRTTTTVTSGAY